MRKISSVLFLVCSLLSLSTSFAQDAVSGHVDKDSKNAEASKVEVGALLSLTGDFAFFGKGIQQGMEMALSDGASSDFKVIYEDNLSINRAAAVSATRKLISVDKVSVILDMVVNTVTALAPVLNDTKTVGLVVWDSNKTISNLSKYVFGLGYSTELAGEDLAQFAYEKLGIRKVAIISVHDEWSELISASFKSKLVALGGSVPIEEQVAIDNSDFRALVTKIRLRKLDAVFAPLFGSAFVSWVRQARELGFKGHLLTGDGVSDNEVQQAGITNSEGLYGSGPWVDDIGFADRYKARFGEERFGMNLSFVAMGYDAINCLSAAKKAIEAKGDIFNSETLRQTLGSFTCTGLTGTVNLSKDRTSDKRERILVVHDGKFELVPE